MRVKLAAQVLSYNVASAICSVNVASEGLKLSDCLQTAKFLYNIDLLFDLCNGAGHRDKHKSQRCLVTDNSIHHSLWQKFYRQMSTWKYVKKVTHKDGTVHVHDTVPPCLSGWKDNIKGFQRLWTTLKTIGFSEMNLRRFNSDPIENLFSVIRQTNGSNRSPTCKQFEHSLKTCIMNGMSHYHIRSKNCLDDDGVALSTEAALFSKGALAVNSNLFVPDKRTFLTRGQPTYLANLMKAQPSRQAISLQCNKVCAKVLKKCAMDCQICRTAVLHQDVNVSSDHMFSANLQSTFNCMEVDQDSLCYAQVATETQVNMQKPGSYASSEIVDRYVNTFKKFVTTASVFLYADNSVSLTKELIAENQNFDWLLKCSEHAGSLKLALIDAMSISFLSRVCALVNKTLRDTLKRKKLVLRLKAKRVCAEKPSDPDNPDWEDLSADEATSLIEMMLSDSSLPGEKGTLNKRCQSGNPVEGETTPKRARVAQHTAQRLTVALSPQIFHVTPIRPAQRSHVVPSPLPNPQVCTPVVRLSQGVVLPTTSYTPTAGRQKVLAGWAAPPPPAPKEPKLTNLFLKNFLTGKGEKGLSRLNKKELLILYDKYNVT